MLAVAFLMTIAAVVTLVSLTGVSTADFWLGLMLILVFAVRLMWLPTSAFRGAQYVILPALAVSWVLSDRR